MGGLIAGAGKVGAMIGPIFIGLIADIYGPSYVFGLMGMIALLVGGILYIKGFVILGKDIEELPSTINPVMSGQTI